MTRSIKAREKEIQLRREVWRLYGESLSPADISKHLGIDESNAIKLINRSINLKINAINQEIKRIKNMRQSLLKNYSPMKHLSDMQKQIFNRRITELDEKEKQANEIITELRDEKIPEEVRKNTVKTVQTKPVSPSRSKNLTDEKDSRFDSLKNRPKLTGKILVSHCLSCRNQNVPETSVCLRAGYKIEEIGQFRKEFCRATSVQFGPLDRMISELLTDVDSQDIKTVNEPSAISKREIKQVHAVVKARNANFRDKVLKAHGSRCACCSVAIDELLEAAHIVPVASNGSDHYSNGLPLCVLHHKAFDRHLFTIDPDSRLIIYRPGFTADSLKICESKISSRISKEALLLRMKIFLGFASL